MHLVFAASKKSLRYIWGLILWMLSFGGARHPALVTPLAPLVVVLSSSVWVVSFLEAIWRWSLKKAHLLAVAEHRLLPARVYNVTTQLRKARRSSVWTRSCQDVTPGGQAELGVISLHGAPVFSSHSFGFHFQRVLSSGARYEGGLTTGQRRHCSFSSSSMIIRAQRAFGRN